MEIVWAILFKKALMQIRPPLATNFLALWYTAVCCSRGWMKGPQWNLLGNIIQKSNYANAYKYLQMWPPLAVNFLALWVCKFV